jgi:hypothetical protein
MTEDIPEYPERFIVILCTSEGLPYIHSDTSALRMKAVAAVAQILHEPEGQSLMTDEHIALIRSCRKSYRIPVEIG